MVKKKTNYIVYLPVAILAVSLIASWVKFQAMAENTRTKVEKLEIDSKIEIDKVKTEIKEISVEGDKELEEVKKDNQEIEKSLTEMRVQQMYMQKSVDTLNENLKELLTEIKKKK